MGVPKFFRWMSERYPGISQLIAENRIPEFDCLYVRRATVLTWPS
jgi:5'-3' exoribonuclease 1